MKILIVSGAFYPNNSPRAFRTTELVKQFSKAGHQVVVYLPKNNENYTEFLNKYPIQINFYNEPRGIIIGNTNGIVNKAANRLLQQFFEYPSSMIITPLVKLLKEEEGYDLLITIAMPHPIHWAVGKLYSKGHRIARTWVADCGDPYMLCGTSQYKHPFYFKYQEQRWCRFCDYISVPNEAAKYGYYPEFRDKIRVIPQAFDFDEVNRKMYSPNRIPTFAFSGNIIPNVRDPRPFLDYLSSLDMNFRFIMYCSKHNLVSSYRDQMPEKFEIHDYIPRLDLLNELSGMDFLVNIENSTTVQTPSKLIDYALTGRPILSINPKNLDKTNIKQFLNGDYSNQYVVTNLEQYNIVNVCNQFINLANITYNA